MIKYVQRKLKLPKCEQNEKIIIFASNFFIVPENHFVNQHLKFKSKWLVLKPYSIKRPKIYFTTSFLFMHH